MLGQNTLEISSPRVFEEGEKKKTTLFSFFIERKQQHRNSLPDCKGKKKSNMETFAFSVEQGAS